MKTKKLIELARRCVDGEYTDCHGCPYETNPTCMDILITELTDRLEGLHKKGKARKVDDAIPFADELIGFCPNCGDGVNSTMYFCSECGQKLKWEVKE